MSRGHARLARRRAKRENQAKTGLILVSLIDIFTVLVIYLLYSSSGVENLPNPDAIKLPESYASQKPKEAHVVTVTQDKVIFGDHQVIDVATLKNSEGTTVPELYSEFDKLSLRANEKGIESRGEVNILADREIPYSVLKRIMATCAVARFEKISLAVNERGSRP